MDENEIILDPVLNNENEMQNDSIHISDVLAVIETDCTNQAPVENTLSSMFNGGGEISQGVAAGSAIPPNGNPENSWRKAYVKIVEEPASKALRFRYQCEGRSAGSIPGANHRPDNKVYPTIEIVGATGPAVAIVSCVTLDPPHRPHPHNLVGKENVCNKGVCTVTIPYQKTMTVSFTNLGIQCVKKKEVQAALNVRRDIRVDPFETGFDHATQPIELNALRLCFQVFLQDQHGKYTRRLKPVVSQPIYDKKAMSDLSIVKLSHCVSYVDGGREDMILLCEKVGKDDIQIRFFEETNGEVTWQGFAEFQPPQVHKQTAICFRTPRYKTLDVTEPVKVYIQLQRPSDGETSEPLPFLLNPTDHNAERRKRPNLDTRLDDLKRLTPKRSNTHYYMPEGMHNIKSEPRESGTSPYQMPMGGLGEASPVYAPQYNITYLGTPSPHSMQPHSPAAEAAASYVPNTTLLPHMGQDWSTPYNNQGMNITNIPPNQVDVPMEMQNNLSSLLNLDNQSEQLPVINSTDLTGLGLCQTLTDNVSNLSLGDYSMTAEHMSNNSLTRLVNNRCDKLVNNNPDLNF